MKYINLIDKLTDADKATINAYVAKYGCTKEHFIGLETWLENWSHANQKLYKLLGNQFIYEFPFSYEKGANEIRNEVENLLYGDNEFRYNFNNFVSWLKGSRDTLEIDNEVIWAISRFLNTSSLVDNKIDDGFKYKRPNGKKMLQIQVGTKPFRAINQLVSYFPEFNWNKTELEDLRKRHAIIFSEKMIKGNACISIHPLDFMTMSDNSSNWTSCMSWKNDGCYHVGTVEMMNSNNVVCCYLKNDAPFIFNEDKTDSETGEIIGVWNNKRWRQLMYVTKDIIMSGKPYPYIAMDLTTKILEEVKNLAEANLNWTYQFGPERYKDMIHIGSLHKMDKQREWIQAKSFKKHNIIWDTRGMYNDMLNDPNTNYMCYRNKVDHTKIISVSGKANCLCCNNDILVHDECTSEYNDRYNDTGNIICPTCIDDYFRCSYCHDIYTTKKLIRSEKNGTICSHCFEKLKICPCCGKPLYIKDRLHGVFSNKYIYDIMNKDEYGLEFIRQKFEYGDFYTFQPTYGYTKEEVENELKIELPQYENDDKKYDTYDGNIYIEALYCCAECAPKVKEELKAAPGTQKFGRKSFWSDKIQTYYITNPDVADKYRFHNMKSVTEEQYMNELVE